MARDVRKSADMVLVAVAQQDRFDAVFPFLEVGDVGDKQVHPQHLLVGKHHPAVEDEDLIPLLQEPHVFADLSDAYKRNERDCRLSFCHDAVKPPPERVRAGPGGLGTGASAVLGHKVAPSPWPRGNASERNPNRHIINDYTQRRAKVKAKGPVEKTTGPQVCTELPAGSTRTALVFVGCAPFPLASA